MSKLTIIRDAKAINNGLNQLKALQQKVHNLLHLLCVSVLVHANEHGDVTSLNRFYGMLTANNQTALKNYVLRFQQEKDENGNWKPTNMAFLRFDTQSKEFRIDKAMPVEHRGTASAFVQHAEKNLINPDGKNFKPFYEQDNIRDAQDFKDDNILTTLRGLASKVHGNSKNVNVQVSEPMMRFVDEMYAKAKDIAEEAKNTGATIINHPAMTKAEEETEAKAEAAPAKKRGRPAKKKAA